MLLEQVKLSQPRRDQLPHKALGQRLVDRIVQRPLRHFVSGEVVTKGRKHGAAVGQVAQMVGERSESGHRLAVELERRNSGTRRIALRGARLEDRLSNRPSVPRFGSWARRGTDRCLLWTLLPVSHPLTVSLQQSRPIWQIWRAEELSGRWCPGPHVAGPGRGFDICARGVSPCFGAVETATLWRGVDRVAGSLFSVEENGCAGAGGLAGGYGGDEIGEHQGANGDERDRQWRRSVAGRRRSHAQTRPTTGGR